MSPSDLGLSNHNNYYAIGNQWSERVQSGKFIKPELNEDIFSDWLTQHTADDSSATTATRNDDDGPYEI